MQKLANVIDFTNLKLGRGVAWLALCMVILMFVNVIQRYIFSANAIWEAELIRYFHAIIFMSAAGYTLLRNEHVRIDLFYQNFSPRKKALINILGTIIFLFPVCISLVYFSWDFVISSWEIQESSPEYGGLPGIFLLKTFIWIFALTFALQGVSVIVREYEVFKAN